ncbi:MULTISPECIES: DUF3208 domain-containing protein [unclassified Meiothermus]|uniref:DUF3208 domain-containing protein n=1 Tax=unclassified Meiothermus TaxID=370471 RepID=UPI000D7CDF5B|nr:MULTISPECIES: DUF3208 domain-containing protein [unclassified Meiothermus]PZA06254.1 DUF3208 domain-containing protein [Meiothermus sp. Pnk-1]RYM39527.1 DUF3208 domain-containing protein [Meiothermus sp. PNK-Is4]
MKGIKLFQGYLWFPRGLEFEPRETLPAELAQGLPDGPVHLLLDEVRPPFAFFEDGTPTEGQRFFQVTALILTEREPLELKPLTASLREELDPYLQATPEGVGWLLLEDLRPV